MVNDPDFGATRFLFVFLLTGGLTAGSVQSPSMLGTLTVPASALPTSCALTPPRPTHAPASRGGMAAVSAAAEFLQFPTNPWSGTNRRLVAMVHRAIDPAPQPSLPDVPPNLARNVAESDRKWAENILEAYHAEYHSEYGDRVEVFAVTFNDVMLTAAPDSLSNLLNPPSGLRSRFVRGATVVLVAAPTSRECVRAIEAHIRSVK